MGLIAPQQPRQTDRVRMAIDTLLTQSPKDDRSVHRAPRRDHAPPSRQKLECGWQVSLRGNQRRAIHYPAIGLYLARKPVESISLGLNLHAADVSVDNGDVYPRSAVGQPEFFEN
jgi:hypothetical protein